MAWIKIDHTTLDKPEVMQIAEKLSITPEQAFGHLCRVWVWADQQSLNGHAISVTEKGLERVSGHAGFVTALRDVGWIKGKDGAFTFPNFDNHNGETAKKRALAYKRQATHRSRSERDISVTRLDKSREEKKIKKSAFALPSWVPEEPWKAWLEVRARNRAPNTHRALQLAVNELDRLRGAGQSPVTLLEKATLSGWRSIWPLKDQPNAAIPIQQKMACDYCGKPRTGVTSGITHCSAHLRDALDGVPVKAA